MKNKFNLFSIFLFALVFISIFYKWFVQDEIIGGDWPYLFRESLSRYFLLVPAWNTWQGNGLGGTNPIYFLQTFEYFTVFLTNALHVPWPVIYKIFWFGFFIFLSVSASIYFISVVLKRAVLWQKLLAAVIFTTNTYILMVVGGGQMGIALAYAVAPLVLARFIKMIDHIARYDNSFQFSIFNFQLALFAGLSLSLQVLFDPRLAYITMIAIAIYTISGMKKKILNTLYLILYTFVVPGIITFLLHSFWILPLVIFSQNICERFCEAYTGVGIVKFLSFSAFSQGLSLLHPNWPENIFGKVYFMRPEFLILPILAFIGLLFVNGLKGLQEKKYIIYFAILGLIGAFLAKGANPPFGGIYIWLFENVPGFVLFRDPTKFYLLVALSYSILIPYSLLEISNKASSRKYKALSITNTYYIILATFLVVWAILIHPAIFGQLRGTFRKHEVLREYVELKDFLHNQPEFFRTLWVPRQQRFSFFSNIHPSVEAGALFNATNSAEIISRLKGENTKEYLSDLAIKYIIVPYDNLGEIFQKDRKYDEGQYANTVNGLESIPWLKKIDNFGKIQILENSSVKDHFWIENNGTLSYKMISPTHYIINVSVTFPQKLIFSEKYDSSWVAKIGKKTIKSQKTSSNLNSFDLKKGNYNLDIIFLQDNAYLYGRITSLATLILVLFLVYKYRKLKVEVQDLTKNLLFEPVENYFNEDFSTLYARSKNILTTPERLQLKVLSN